MNIVETKVCVLGLGYIGLPTASLLGTKGFEVQGVDIDPSIVKTINEGNIHIHEPDLDILVKSAVQSGRLKAAAEPGEADVFILTVPTPLKENREPDLSYVEAAVLSITPYLKPGNIVILESTCPVGTTLEVVVTFLQESHYEVGRDIYVAYCPERVLPGRILIELVENDRIVGGINEASTDKAIEFYKSFVRGEVLATDATTAELAKLSENTFRDVNIALANELSMVAHQEGVNIWELLRLANRHPRVNILQPGPGVGGHCIAVDPWFIVARSQEQARLIRTAREVNDYKPYWVIERVKASANKFKRPVIGCLGLAFKADVGDLRESPALEIVKQLQAERVGELLISEPNLQTYDAFELKPPEFVIAKSDIVLVLVDHKQFRSLKAQDLHEKILIDTRGIFQ